MVMLTLEDVTLCSTYHIRGKCFIYWMIQYYVVLFLHIINIDMLKGCVHSLKLIWYFMNIFMFILCCNERLFLTSNQKNLK